jgi:hypothetical protein
MSTSDWSAGEAHATHLMALCGDTQNHRERQGTVLAAGGGGNRGGSGRCPLAFMGALFTCARTAVEPIRIASQNVRHRAFPSPAPHLESFDSEFPFWLSDLNSSCRPNCLPRQGLAQFCFTVFPALPGRPSFTFGGHATLGNERFSKWFRRNFSLRLSVVIEICCAPNSPLSRRRRQPFLIVRSTGTTLELSVHSPFGNSRGAIEKWSGILIMPAKIIRHRVFRSCHETLVLLRGT